MGSNWTESKPEADRDGSLAAKIVELLRDRDKLKSAVTDCFRRAAGFGLRGKPRDALNIEGVKSFLNALVRALRLPQDVLAFEKAPARSPQGPEDELWLERFVFHGGGLLRAVEAYLMARCLLWDCALSLTCSRDLLVRSDITFKMLSGSGYQVTQEACKGGGPLLASDKLGEFVCIASRQKESLNALMVEDLIDEFECMRRKPFGGVSRTFEVFQDDQLFYIVSEPFYGGNCTTLKRKAREQGIRMTEDWWRQMFRQLFEAVLYLHEQAIIHCDLKEPNIMLKTQCFITPQVFLVDIGLARAAAVNFQVQSKVPAGTPGYIPPETWETGRWLPRGDVFSLGIVIMQMMTDKIPKESPTLGKTQGGLFLEGCSSVEDVALATRTRNPPFDLMPPGFPDLARLVRKLLDKDPSHRLWTQEVLADRWFVGLDGEAAAREADATAAESTLRMQPPGAHGSVGEGDAFIPPRRQACARSQLSPGAKARAKGAKPSAAAKSRFDADVNAKPKGSNARPGAQRESKARVRSPGLSPKQRPLPTRSSSVPPSSSEATAPKHSPPTSGAAASRFVTDVSNCRIGGLVNGIITAVWHQVVHVDVVVGAHKVAGQLLVPDGVRSALLCGDELQGMRIEYIDTVSKIFTLTMECPHLDGGDGDDSSSDAGSNRLLRQVRFHDCS